MTTHNWRTIRGHTSALRRALNANPIDEAEFAIEVFQRDTTKLVAIPRKLAEAIEQHLIAYERQEGILTDPTYLARVQKKVRNHG